MQTIKAALLKAKQVAIDSLLPLSARRELTATIDRLDNERFLNSKKEAMVGRRPSVRVVVVRPSVRVVVVVRPRRRRRRPLR